MPTWPASLQQYLSEDGFGLQKGDTTLRSDMDYGPQKVRRRYTRSVDEVTGSIMLKSLAEYNTFENFYNTTTAGGSLPFTFNHPITQVPGAMRFKSVPTYRSLGGGKFMVSFAWEIMP